MIEDWIRRKLEYKTSNYWLNKYLQIIKKKSIKETLTILSDFEKLNKSIETELKNNNND